MAILSFKKRFASKVRKGLKTQTIRDFRKYPVIPFEQLYLYTGLRTIHAVKLGEGQALAPVKVTLRENSVTVYHMVRMKLTDLDMLNQFAVADGFKNWADMKQYWKEERGHKCFPYTGTLITWIHLPKNKWRKLSAAERKRLKAQFA